MRSLNRGLIPIIFAIALWLSTRVLDKLYVAHPKEWMIYLVSGWSFFGGFALVVICIYLIVKRNRFKEKPWLWATTASLVIALLFIVAGAYVGYGQFERERTAQIARSKLTDEVRPLSSDYEENESQKRKERSIAWLEANDIPVNVHLPRISDTRSAKRRTLKEIAPRAISLCIVALKGEGADQEDIEWLIVKFDARNFMSPDEIEFIDNPTPDEDDRLQFSWRYESLWVMLWALGYVENLGPPSDICDVERAVSTVAERTLSEFLLDASLRDLDTILDEADLAYRCHWATRNANLTGKEIPAGLDSSVILERHHALNWLIGYTDDDWDDVPTDT